jgi:hypothetical protein
LNDPHPVVNVAIAFHWDVGSLSRPWTPQPLTTRPAEMARKLAGYKLRKPADGAKSPNHCQPIPEVGRGADAIRIDCPEGWFQVMYVAKVEEAIYVLARPCETMSKSPRNAIAWWLHPRRESRRRRGDRAACGKQAEPAGIEVYPSVSYLLRDSSRMHKLYGYPQRVATVANCLLPWVSAPDFRSS